MDNQAALTIKAFRQAGAITLDVTADKPYLVRLVNVQMLSTDGADIRIEENDTIVMPEAMNC